MLLTMFANLACIFKEEHYETNVLKEFSPPSIEIFRSAKSAQFQYAKDSERGISKKIYWQTN